MKAFLLAAGKGTRLRPLTNTMPKCLLPIGGKPLLAIWLELLERHGISDVLINTHHLAEQVESFLRCHQKDVRLNIEISHEDVLLGSAGTLWRNRDFVTNEQAFLIAYADNLTNAELTDLFHVHRRTLQQGGILTMALFHAPNPAACGIASIDPEGRITAFEEKPRRPRGDLANAGIYVASEAIFEVFPQPVEFRDSGILDIGHDILPRLVNRMFGTVLNAYLRDIGTPESYQAALEEWPPKALNI
ncbi:MAG: nucleotidyltransferase family protein [Thermodesulfobacteriota bacterium]